MDVAGRVGRGRVAVAVFGLLVAVLVASGTPVLAQGVLTVTYLDVGQADATLLEHDEVTVLIDTGDWQRSDVVDYLAAEGIDELDLLVVTHPHADHIGQFDRIMDAVEVSEVWWSGSTTTTQTFERALSALEASDADYAEPRAGERTSLGPLDIEIVNPPAGHDLSNLHDASLAMRITYGDVRLLFTGDAETATEARMVGRSANQLAADVYQVGHHGSSTSTSQAFLDAVDPQVAIYSAGAGNQYGHPHAEVLERIGAAGVELYGTDVNGTVTLTTDGSGGTITPTSGEPFTFGAAQPDPDPAFPDIVGTTHEANIGFVADRGIVGGFADGTYRPGASVTRGQMATFIANAVNPPAYAPPPVDEIVTCVDINSADADLLQHIVHIGAERAQEIISLRPFSTVSQLDRVSGIGPARLSDILDEGIAAVGCDNGTGGSGSSLPVSDVAGTTHEDSILAIVQAGIAGGFADGTYRPGVSVTRGQMATFIVNAFDVPPGSADLPDIAGTAHETNIETLVAAGIAGGFGDGTYRPGDVVTRGQMATFIANAIRQAS